MRVLRTELARTGTSFRRAYSSSTGTQTTESTSTGTHTPAEPETDEPSHNTERPEPSLVIRTLQPTRLTSTDLLMINLDASTSVTVFSPHADSHTPECRLSFSKLPARHGQRGWLYYHQPPSGPPLAGEVRFRITASEGPASFASGVDAVTRSGIPWCIPLPVIALDQSYAVLRHLLTDEDRMVSRDVMREASKLSRIPERCVHAFGQPFELSMQAGTHRVTLAGKKGLGNAELRNIAVAGFETIPAAQSGEGTRHVKHMPFLGKSSLPRCDPSEG